MEITIFFARFWGAIFISLGLMSISARFLGRVIKYTEDKTITVSTGYITFLLGLVTVILHNIWVANWSIVITILGWVTLIKGVTKIGFPEYVHKRAQKFKAQQIFWSVIILFLGIWLLYMGFFS